MKKSRFLPEEANVFFAHVMLEKVGKKDYLGEENGYHILCTCRHPREALTSHQKFGKCTDWESIIITKHNKCILSIYRDQLL